MRQSPLTSIRRLPVLGRGVVLCLVVLGMGVQGLSLAVERIAAPSHGHLPRASAVVEELAMQAPPRSFARDDHRRIPWIGGEPPPVIEIAAEAHAHTHAHTHAHDGVAAHRHALGDEGVIYVDADDDTAGAQSTATACPLPAAAPRLPSGPSGVRAAWRHAKGWHALALSSEPLERPPR